MSTTLSGWLNPFNQDVILQIILGRYHSWGLFSIDHLIIAASVLGGIIYIYVVINRIISSRLSHTINSLPRSSLPFRQESLARATFVSLVREVVRVGRILYNQRIKPQENTNERRYGTNQPTLNANISRTSPTQCKPAPISPYTTIHTPCQEGNIKNLENMFRGLIFTSDYNNNTNDPDNSTITTTSCNSDSEAITALLSQCGPIPTPSRPFYSDVSWGVLETEIVSTASPLSSFHANVPMETQNTQQTHGEDSARDGGGLGLGAVVNDGVNNRGMGTVGNGDSVDLYNYLNVTINNNVDNSNKNADIQSQSLQPPQSPQPPMTKSSKFSKLSKLTKSQQEQDKRRQQQQQKQQQQRKFKLHKKINFPTVIKESLLFIQYIVTSKKPGLELKLFKSVRQYMLYVYHTFNNNAINSNNMNVVNNNINNNVLISSIYDNVNMNTDSSHPSSDHNNVNTHTNSSNCRRGGVVSSPPSSPLLDISVIYRYIELYERAMHGLVYNNDNLYTEHYFTQQRQLQHFKYQRQQWELRKLEQEITQIQRRHVSENAALRSYSTYNSSTNTRNNPANNQSYASIDINNSLRTNPAESGSPLWMEDQDDYISVNLQGACPCPDAQTLVDTGAVNISILRSNLFAQSFAECSMYIPAPTKLTVDDYDELTAIVLHICRHINPKLLQGHS